MILIIVVVVVTAYLALILLLRYALLSSEVGPDPARRMMIPDELILFPLVVVVPVLAWASFSLLRTSMRQDQVESGLWLVGAVGFIGITFFQLWQMTSAGRVLLTLQESSTRHNILKFGAVSMALLGIILLVTANWDQPHTTRDRFHGIFLLAWAGYCIVAGVSKREIRERGFSQFGSLLRWEQIQSYEWEEGGCTLTLGIKRRLPFFRTTSIPIPFGREQAVETVLRENDRRMAGRI